MRGMVMIPKNCIRELRDLRGISLYDLSYEKTDQTDGPKPEKGWYVICKKWVMLILFIYLF